MLSPWWRSGVLVVRAEGEVMRRKVFDVLVSAGWAVIVVVLLVAGGLAVWGHSVASSNVRNQLAQQQIFFPSRAAFAQAKPGTEITPGMIPYLEQYAGQAGGGAAVDALMRRLRHVRSSGPYTREEMNER